MTDFREGGPFWPPHPRAAPKMPILNRVNVVFLVRIVIFFITIIRLFLNVFSFVRRVELCPHIIF